VTYETVREWRQKFGSLYAVLLKRKRARIGSKWRLDEVFIKINGVQHYLWRAVDQKGAVIDILVQPKRDRWAALRFFRKLLHVAKKRPRVIITDKPRSYAAAKKLIMPNIEHLQSRYLNNRAGNSHQPTRVREKQMKRFKSSEQAQRFLSIFEFLNAPFRLRRHLLSATRYRLLLNQSFYLWNKPHSRYSLHSFPSERIHASPQPWSVKLTMPRRMPWRR
jgi:putative transposase